MMYDVPPPKFFQRFEERSFSLSEIKRRAVFSSADGSVQSAYSCKVSGSPCPLISAPSCGADDFPEFACKMKHAVDWSQSAVNPIVDVYKRQMFAYFPVLIFSGVASGAAIGIISWLILQRLPRV